MRHPATRHFLSGVFAFTLFSLAIIQRPARSVEDTPKPAVPVTPAEPPSAPTPAIDREFKIDAQPDGFPVKFTFEAAKLFKHADYLASDECEGRLAASPGEAKARAYIVNRLKEIGYADVRKYPFEFIADVKLGAGNALNVNYESVKEEGNWYRKPQVTGTEPCGAPRQWGAAFKLDDDYRPMRISKAGDFKNAPLVFAGYGVSAPDKNYDDYRRRLT